MRRRFLHLDGSDTLQIDLDGATIHRADGTEAPLTPTQLCLLEVLVAHRGGCVSRAELVAEGVGDPAGTVKDVRAALGDRHAPPRFVVTRPGVGYKLERCRLVEIDDYVFSAGRSPEARRDGVAQRDG